MDHYKIYVIRCTLPNYPKPYVGLTKRTLQVRFKEHKSSARKDKGCVVLSRSMEKYGLDNFKIELLEDLGETTKDKANEAEIRWITKLNSVAPNGLNVSKGGQLNADPTPEEKERLSELARKRYVDHPELREVSRKRAEVSLNTPDSIAKAQAELKRLREEDPAWVTEKARKMSEAKKGRTQDPEVVERRAAAQRGTTHATHFRKYPDDSELPKYVTIRRDILKNGEVKLGVMANDRVLPKKNFTSQSDSLEEKIRMAIEYLATSSRNSAAQPWKK